MIEFPHYKFRQKKDGASIISNADIEDFAEQVLQVYKPELLQKPQTIDWTDFLEKIGLNIHFEKILPHPDGDDILGTCTFGDLESLPIYNDEFDRKEKKILNTGDVVLNVSLETQPQRLLFTGLHEGGHWLLHKPFYFAKYPAKGQMTMFGNEERIVKCCRKSDIEKRQKLVTTEDHLENQANVFAAAIAVPRKLIKKLVPDLFKKHDYRKLKASESENTMERFSKRCYIIDELATIFGVSKQVIDIRLAQLGLWYETSESLQQQFQELLDDFLSSKTG